MICILIHYQTAESKTGLKSYAYGTNIYLFQHTTVSDILGATGLFMFLSITLQIFSLSALFCFPFRFLNLESKYY